MNESLSVSGRYRANRNNVSLTLQSKQDFLLSVTPARMDFANQPGSYMVRFKGPIDLLPEIK